MAGHTTGTSGLDVPKIKIRHHKKYLVQPDSLEAGAGVSQPPLQLRGNRIYFSFLFLSFISFLHFFLSFSFIGPRCWPQIGPGTGFFMLFCWPRYWPQIGPGTGFLCFSAGPGTGQEAPVLAFYVSLLAPVLAKRPRYNSHGLSLNTMSEKNSE